MRICPWIGHRSGGLHRRFSSRLAAKKKVRLASPAKFDKCYQESLNASAPPGQSGHHLPGVTLHGALNFDRRRPAAVIRSRTTSTAFPSATITMRSTAASPPPTSLANALRLTP
jgi:hypothetical protein